MLCVVLFCIFAVSNVEVMETVSYKDLSGENKDIVRKHRSGEDVLDNSTFYHRESPNHAFYLEASRRNGRKASGWGACWWDVSLFKRTWRVKDGRVLPTRTTVSVVGIGEDLVAVKNTAYSKKEVCEYAEWLLPLIGGYEWDAE